MRSKLKLLVVTITLFSWPFNLYLANTKSDFFDYLYPLILLFLSFLLYKEHLRYYLLPTLLIPVFEPKLAVFPILFVLLSHLFSKDLKSSIALVIISLIVAGSVWKSFWGQTIFVPDYQARQEVIRNIHLYPNPILARIFHNKARIYIDKFNDNFFALTDPNNYFFAFHPREITVTNQNLDKYSYLSIFFFLAGVYYFGKNPHKKFIFQAFLSGIISLSILVNFDRQDFILWLPIGLTLMLGIDWFFSKKSKLVYIFGALFIVFGFIQFVRNLIAFT